MNSIRVLFYWRTKFWIFFWMTSFSHSVEATEYLSSCPKNAIASEQARIDDFPADHFLFGAPGIFTTNPRMFGGLHRAVAHGGTPLRLRLQEGVSNLDLLRWAWQKFGENPHSQVEKILEYEYAKEKLGYNMPSKEKWDAGDKYLWQNNVIWIEFKDIMQSHSYTLFIDASSLTSVAPLRNVLEILEGKYQYVIYSPTTQFMEKLPDPPYLLSSSTASRPGHEFAITKDTAALLPENSRSGYKEVSYSFDNGMVIIHPKNLQYQTGSGQNDTGKLVRLYYRVGHNVIRKAYNLTNRSEALDSFFPQRILNPERYKGKVVADVGSAGGAWVEILLSHGAKAYGIDIVQTPEQMSKPQYIRAQSTEKVFYDGTVDYFFSSNSVFSYGAPKEVQFQTLQRMHAAMKTGGKIFISHNYSEVKELVDSIPGLKVEPKLEGEKDQYNFIEITKI